MEIGTIRKQNHFQESTFLMSPSTSLCWKRLKTFQTNFSRNAIRCQRELVSFELFSTFFKIISAFSVGQLVYSSGFPHFSSLGSDDQFLPSIFEGRITKISRGVIFTDASVQAGQSGGPVFSDQGHLLGISISNSKDDNYRLIYPNINMSVPVYDILPILQKYGQTRGTIRIISLSEHH